VAALDIWLSSAIPARYSRIPNTTILRSISAANSAEAQGRQHAELSSTFAFPVGPAGWSTDFGELAVWLLSQSPIVTLTWVLLHKNYPDKQKAKALQDLFRWCLTEGQKYAPELGYTQLPPNVVARSLVAVENMQ
jgi:ABC-type phosphate transport system substrate-binding protein